MRHRSIPLRPVRVHVDDRLTTGTVADPALVEAVGLDHPATRRTRSKGLGRTSRVDALLDERDALEDLVSKGTVAAQKRRHASILLFVDEGTHGPAMRDAEAAEATDITSRTVE